MTDAPGRRRRYEQDVWALADHAEMLRTAGEPVEAIARAVVTERNRLKAAYRMDDDPRLVAIMEMRNLRKYGDPLGPTAEGLRNRYADWEAVIAAACRPARLVD